MDAVATIVCQMYLYPPRGLHRRPLLSLRRAYSVHTYISIHILVLPTIRVMTPLLSLTASRTIRAHPVEGVTSAVTEICFLD